MSATHWQWGLQKGLKGPGDSLQQRGDEGCGPIPKDSPCSGILWAITKPTCEGLSHRRPGSGAPGEKAQEEGPGHSAVYSGPRVCPMLPLLAQALALWECRRAGVDNTHFPPGGGRLREERIPEHKSNEV